MPEDLAWLLGENVRSADMVVFCVTGNQHVVLSLLKTPPPHPVPIDLQNIKRRFLRLIRRRSGEAPLRELAVSEKKNSNVSRNALRDTLCG